MLIYLLIVFFSVLIGYQIIVKNREGLEYSLNDHDDLIIVKQQLKEYKPLVTQPDGEPTMLLSRVAKLENEVKGLINQGKNQSDIQNLNNDLKAQDTESKKKEKNEDKADMEKRKKLAKIGNENGE